MTTRITIRKPDDWHCHVRDGEMLKAVMVVYGKFSPTSDLRKTWLVKMRWRALDLLSTTLRSLSTSRAARKSLMGPTQPTRLRYI